MSDIESLKQQAAQAALQYIEPNSVIGVGTGSTVHYFIEALETMKHDIQGAIPSSQETEQKLKAAGIPIAHINAGPISVYVDGADEFNDHGQLIKGGGGALTREKIIAACSDKFVCIVDESKHVKVLGEFPLAVEVIPLGRSLVARELVKLGGDPVYREDFVTDNGNQILDVYNLDLTDPIKTEEAINNITGAVCNGLFAKKGANVILMATKQGIQTFKP